MSDGCWPTPAAGFAPDVSFGNNLGITGYHTANLWLSEPALVRLEFSGRGDADYQNQFKVNGTVVYDTTTASTNGPNPTGSYLFGVRLVPFTYIANSTNQGGAGDVYIGLSDRPEGVPDHDFQDLTVRVSIVGVPDRARSYWPSSAWAAR